MKVKELIEELGRYPEDADIAVGAREDDAEGVEQMVERCLVRIDSSHGLVTPEDFTVILIGGAEL
jgi:hypothetical protein